MARGLEVLQAALDGKQVRYLIADQIVSNQRWSRWMDFDGLEDREIRKLFTREWEIRESMMTFTEAVAAMEAGHTVERPINIEYAERIQLRDCADPLAYEIRHFWYGRWAAWVKRAFFTKTDIHATDWHVVSATVEETVDARPTKQEATDYLFKFDQPWRSPEQRWYQNHAYTEALTLLADHWPALFRKESDDD